MSESDIVRAILALPLPAVLFRNQVGAARTLGGMRISTGLGKGSSDIVGFTNPGGKFIAIEVKDGDESDPTPEQLAFLDSVNRAGGIAFLARSVQDVVDFLLRGKKI